MSNRKLLRVPSATCLLHSNSSANTSKIVQIIQLHQVKTNAARLLDSLGVRYDLREYEVDPDDLSAESVASKIAMPAEQVFKTLLARGDRNGACFAVVPGDQQLNLKELAKLSGDKNIDMVPLK